MKKRILSLIIGVVLLLSSFCNFAYATDEPKYVLESQKQSVYVDDTFDVNVSIANNPGLISLRFSITYDTEKLQLTGVTNQEMLSGYTTPAPTISSPYTLRWADNYATSNNEANGCVAILHFKALATGSAAVSVTHGESRNANGQKVAFSDAASEVTVSARPVAVTGVSLDKTTATVTTGNTVTLTPVFTPDTATNKNVTWTSSDTTVATVDGGVVSGVKKGNATITVQTEDGSFEATCAVTVECGHNTTHTVNAEVSTCLTQGHGSYTVCDECGEIIVGSDELLPLGNHAYIEKVEAQYLVSAATCNHKAVYYKSCSVCGAASTETFEYGEVDAANHVGTTYKLNQKEATCYEEGYTGDIYCSDCQVLISTGSVIGKTEHNPASTWSTDATYHWHDCQTIGCGNLIDKAEHTGGEATCNHKAVCSVCGVEYGELNTDNHKNTEIRDAKTATCCEDGYTGDTYCKDCGKKLATGSVIPATGEHVDADGAWETDGTNHWHTCYFGTKFDSTSHIGGTATCKDCAVCSICGTSYGELDAANHAGETETRDAAAASCSTDGYTGDTYCRDCGEQIATGSVIPATGEHVDANGAWETDGTNHWHTCTCGAIFDTTAHAGGTATCKDKAVCTVCGTEYGEINAANHAGNTYKQNQREATCCEEGYTGDVYCSDCDTLISAGTVIGKTEHSPASVWTTDETYHWHICKTIGCGSIMEKAEHSGGVATCKDKAVCSVCGVEYGGLNPENHTGNTEIRDAAEAKCDTEGYTGDTYCKDCGELLESGHSIDKIAHTITEWTVTKEPTTTECGEKTGVCSGCGATFTTEIAKLSAEPISEENTEYSGMSAAPTLVPSGDTVLPENVVFVAQKLDAESLSAEQKTEAAKAVKAIEADAASYVGAEKTVEKVDVLCVLNFDLLLRNVDKQSGDALGDEAYHFDGSVTVTMEMPAEMKAAKNPAIVHLKDDGTCEPISFTVNSDGTISLTVTGFSSFILLDVKTSKAPEKNTDPATPKTGDNSASALWMGVFAASSVGLVLAVMPKKKKER